MTTRDRLAPYRSRRDFRRTPEPPAGRARERAGPGAGLERGRHPFFVIQQHDASTLHFDFRLEVDGALCSWAVPKGLSTDPSVKRLAIRTEDHPLAYADFEGVIPAGQYGGGAVIVWDAGPYRNLSKDAKGKALGLAAALRRGRAAVWLEGRKLRGGYALVHARVGGDPKHWLVIKQADEGADARRRPASTQPRSVLSGRTVEEVAREGARDARRERPEGRR